MTAHTSSFTIPQLGPKGKLTFVVMYLGFDGSPIGEEEIDREDLTEAVRAGARRLLYPRTKLQRDAQGVYVRRKATKGAW